MTDVIRRPTLVNVSGASNLRPPRENASTPLQFSKFEGLGNDFAILDLRVANAVRFEKWVAILQPLAAALCDRRRGIGADGLLIVGPASDSNCLARMIVINADGSRPEMCGNGLRCVAHFLANGSNRDFIVQTDNGPLACQVEIDSAFRANVTVDMGPSHILGRERPAVAPEREFLSVSMGNPHAIHFVARGEDPRKLAETLGPAIEIDSAYPHRTNVEFVACGNTGPLTTWVWERGCGITDACGTGACATAAAAVSLGIRKADEMICVELPGGSLEITIPLDPQHGVRMRGPSQSVYAGAISNLDAFARSRRQ